MCELALRSRVLEAKAQPPEVVSGEAAVVYGGQTRFFDSPAQGSCAKFEICWNKLARKIFPFASKGAQRSHIHRVGVDIVRCCSVHALVSFRVGNGSFARGFSSAPILMQGAGTEVAGTWDFFAYHPLDGFFTRGREIRAS